MVLLIYYIRTGKRSGSASRWMTVLAMTGKWWMVQMKMMRMIRMERCTEKLLSMLLLSDETANAIASQK